MTPTLTFTPPQADFYTWQRYRCAYEFYPGEASQTPLLLIHPIGVGLSREFWHRFCEQWQGQGARNPIYSPDLLGCGESTMPQVAYYPEDWAAQLLVLIQTVIQQPVILVVQGALLPVAIRLMQQLPAQQSDWVKGIILSGPPAWRVMTEAAPLNRQRALWNLFLRLQWANYSGNMPAAGNLLNRFQFASFLPTQPLLMPNGSICWSVEQFGPKAAMLYFRFWLDFGGRTMELIWQELPNRLW